MGKPRLIIIVRHGESEANHKSVNQVVPNHKVNLTARGHVQAQAAGRRLAEQVLPGEKIAFYSSPYKRTRQTTEEMSAVVGAAGIPFQIHEEPRLREQDFGNFQGSAEEMKEIWIARARYGHFFYRIPNGESAADVFDRCSGFNETLYRQFEHEDFPEVLVLVTHGIWARVFLMKWFGWSYEKFESLRNVSHCQFLVMERQAEDKGYILRTHLLTWNDPVVTNGQLCEELRDALNNTPFSTADLQDLAVREKQILEEYKAARIESPTPAFVTQMNRGGQLAD